MLLAALAISFFTPLILAPHLLFYYDVTPKVIVLFLGAAIALAFASHEFDSIRTFCGTRYGLWFAIGAVATIAVAVIGAGLSPDSSLAWNGSNWRRYGALTGLAVIIAALGIACSVSNSRRRLFALLRAMCAAGFLSSLYGIAQYFGWDPFLPASAYQAGEGVFQIVRPPGTLGHSDYFAAFLLWPVFAGVGLWKFEERRAWKILGGLATCTGMIAILMSGSRGALLATVAGLGVLIALVRPRVRTCASVAAVAALAFAIFYVSPAGERLRARAHWIADDPAGGARLLLWRDSLRMSATKPFTGFGPDAFVAEFPHFQSVELEQAYPDFYHESPHNMFLDALTSGGIPGLLALAAVAAIGIIGALRAPAESRAFVVALLPGLIATLVAQQFVVFTAPGAFYFYLGSGLLAGLGSANRPVVHSSLLLRRTLLVGGLAGAILFGIAAYRLVATDAALATVQRRLDRGDARGAAEAYRDALNRPAAGISADLYFSRRWAKVAANSSDAFSRIYYSQIAAGAAARACRSPEQRQNAWYNLAMLAASRNDAQGVEQALRGAIDASPNWYKPHWSLARLLASLGREAEAQSEARKALNLNGDKDAEVAVSLAKIIGSGGPRP